MKRYLLAALSAFMAFSLISCDPQSGPDGGDTASGSVSDSAGVSDTQNDPVPSIFDEENIVASYGAISDIHIGRTNAADNKFKNALEVLKKEAAKGDKNGLDAVIAVGDLTHEGKNKEITRLVSLYNEGAKDIPFVIASGNHDNFLDDYLDAFGETASECIVEMNGKHNALYKVADHYMIALTPVSYIWDGDIAVKHSDKTKKWLDDTLKSITEKDPDSFVFVLSHAPIKDTVRGWEVGNFWHTDDLGEILDKYSQAVSLSGHLHRAVNDSLNIMQTGFTSVACGSVCYLGIGIEGDNFADMKDGLLFDAESQSNGLLIQIDKDGNMRIRRMNFAKEEAFSGDWEIPAPKKDGSHLNLYTMDREKTNEAPKLGSLRPKTGIIKDLGGGKKGRELTIEFSSGSDDEYVYYYTLRVEDENGNEITDLMLISDFYKVKDQDSMKLVYSRRIGEFEVGTKFKVTLTAYDTWGAASETKTADIEIK